MTTWVLTIAWPHRAVRAPERPCAECGWACPPGHWQLHLCGACYMRRWRRRQGRASRRYYPPGVGCTVCGAVPRPRRHRKGGRGLARGLCPRHYMAWLRQAQRAGRSSSQMALAQAERHGAPR